MRYWKVAAIATAGILLSACGPDMPSRSLGTLALMIGGVCMLVLAAEQVNYTRELPQ